MQENPDKVRDLAAQILNHKDSSAVKQMGKNTFILAPLKNAGHNPLQVPVASRKETE